MRYDLLVLGSGPDASRAAVRAAENHRLVALAECRTGRPDQLVSVAQLRSAARQLAADGTTDLRSLRRLAADLAQRDAVMLRGALERHGIDLFSGDASFTAPHALEVVRPEERHLVEADQVLIATGTCPARPAYIPFDRRSIVDADELLMLDRLPRSMVIVGGGSTGVEHALIFASLGVEITVVDSKEELLDSCDARVLEPLLHFARSLDVLFRLGQDVSGIRRQPDGRGLVQLAGGRRLTADVVLVCLERLGNTGHLNLPAAGLEADERDRLWCDERGRTWVPHISAAGDVVGFPAVAECAAVREMVSAWDLVPEPDRASSTKLLASGV